MKKINTQSAQDSTLVNSTIKVESGGELSIGTNITANQVIIVQSSPANELPTLWGSPPLENPYFFEPLTMHAINAVFEKAETALSVVIAGLGGIGKTELAKRYFYHPQKKYNSRLWFTADSRASLELEYQLLAKELNIIEGHESNDLIKRKIFAFLAKHPGWLLVLDNADEVSTLEDLLPPEGGDMLITSRQPHWQAKIISVAHMEENEAILLYKKLRGEQKDKEEQIKALVHDLGYLPLAIAQAVAYIKHAPHMDAGQYLTLFKQYQSNILGTNKLSVVKEEDKSRLTLTTTWQLSLDAIERKYDKSDPSRHYARSLLNACSYLDFNEIPLELLQVYLGRLYAPMPDVLVLNEAIDQLNSYSLIQVNNKTLSIHSLTHTVIKLQLVASNNEEQLNQLILALDEVFNYQRYNLETHEQIDRQKEKIIYDQLIVHIDKLSQNNIHPKTHGLLLKLVQYLIDVKANFKLAQTLLERLAKLHLDTQAQQSLTTKVELLREKSYLAMSLGSTKQAMIELEAALAFIKRGKEGEVSQFIVDTLYCQLGNGYYLLGLYDKAQAQYRQVLTHAQTDGYNQAQAWCGLGNISLAQGTGQAELAYKKSLEMYHKIGKHVAHKEIARLYHNLALVNHEQKDYKTALQYFDKTQEVYQNFYFSQKHIDIAICLYNTARTLFYLGKLEDAEAKVLLALKIYNNVYGVAGHIDTVAIVFYLGFLRCRQDKYEDGLGKYQRSLEIYDSSYKQEKEDQAYANLHRYAKAYIDKKEYKNAEECYLILMQNRYPLLKQKGTRILQIPKEEKKTSHGQQIFSPEQNALFSACNLGDLKHVFALMDTDANVKLANAQGHTPLYIAAKAGHLSIVKHLVSMRNVQVDADNNSIFIASSQDHFQIVDFLINTKCKGERDYTNPQVWNQYFSIAHMICGAMRVSYIKTIIDKVVDNFFSNDVEISNQASELMISFDVNLLPSLNHLQNKREGKSLRKSALEEIIFTLCIFDASMIFSLFRNTIAGNWGNKSEDAAVLLSAMGISNSNALQLFNNAQSLDVEIDELLYINMEKCFIFEAKALPSLPSNQNTSSNSNIFSSYSYFYDENNNIRSEKSNKLLREIQIAITEISNMIDLKIGNREKVSLIIQYLTHPYAIIRLAAQNAAIKLQLMEHKDILDCLIKNLVHPNWRVRAEAVKLLSRKPRLNASQLACLDNTLSDAIPYVRQARALALVRNDSKNDQVVGILSDNLLDPDWKIRYNAIKVITKIASITPIIINRLVICLADKDEDVQSMTFDRLKELLRTHLEIILNSIAEKYMTDNAEYIPSAVGTFISDFCLKKGQEIAAAGILFKILVFDRKNSWGHYKADDALSKTFINHYYNDKTIFDSLIKDSRKLSLVDLEILVVIFSGFIRELFVKTIASPDILISVVTSFDQLKKALCIFPEYNQAILQSYYKHFINTKKFTIRTEGDIKGIEEFYPEQKLVISRKLLENPEYFYSFVKTISELIIVIKKFPGNADLFLDRTFGDPVWLLCAKVEIYHLQSLVNTIPQKNHVIANNIINDNHWLTTFVKQPSRICNLAEIFPEYKNCLFEKYLANDIWFYAGVDGLYVVENLATHFPEYHEQLFNKTLGNRLWFSLHMKQGYDMSATNRIAKAFPKQRSLLSKDTILNPAWLSAQNIWLRELILLSESFPENRLYLFDKFVENDVWFLKYVNNIQDLQFLANAFIEHHERIFKKTLENSQWFIKNMNKEYGFDTLEPLIKCFPAKKDFLCNKTVNNPGWIRTHVRSLDQLVKLTVLFPGKKEVLFKVLLTDISWFLALISSPHELNKLLAQMPEHKDRIMKIIEDNIFSLPSRVAVFIDSMTSLSLAVAMFAHHKDLIFSVTLKDPASIPSFYIKTYSSDFAKAKQLFPEHVEFLLNTYVRTAETSSASTGLGARPAWTNQSSTSANSEPDTAGFIYVHKK